MPSGPRLRLSLITIAAALAASIGACGGQSAEQRPSLAAPDAKAIATPAPDSFRVAFETSKGRFVVEAHRSWAPNGVDRFYHLAKLGFYDDVRFFRVLPGFMAQFGMNGTPSVTKAWDPMSIPDDSVKQSNARGMVTFAMGGPNTRTTQLFINYVDNHNLDGMGFAPIGRVVEGMQVVDSLNGAYGEGPPGGYGPDQTRLGAEGNAYLERSFPKLDFIKSARVIGEPTR
jgi:peptidyl-prolyl cis-trans isomerase A (cyclophilin A)